MIRKTDRDIRTLVTGFGDSDFDYVELTNADWLFIEQRLRTKIPHKLKIQLSGITMIYSLGSYATPQMTSLTKAKSDILLWSTRTRDLRNSLWKKPRKKTTSIPLTLKNIIADNFHLRRGMHTALFPLAHLAQFLDGAESIGRYFIDLLDKENTNSKRTELWLIWAALVIALCRTSNVAVEQTSKNSFTQGFLVLMEKLQATLELSKPFIATDTEKAVKKKRRIDEAAEQLAASCAESTRL